MSKSGKMVFRRGQEPVPNLVNHYRGHKGNILSICFHPNLQTVFTSSEDTYVMCWNFKKETRALRFEGHTGPVNQVSLSQYGDLMVTASDDCTARIWVPVINGQFISIKGHQKAVKTACFNPVDSTVFATGSIDKTVKLWSVQAAKMKSGSTKFKSHDFIQSFCGHTNWVRSVRFSPDGRLLCSASDDKTIQLWDVRTKTRQAAVTLNMVPKLGRPMKADFNPCGSSYVGVASSENAFLMYDVRNKELVQSYSDLFARGAVTSFDFDNSGDFVVCVSEDPKIKILDLIEGRPIFTLSGPRKKLNDVAFNSDGSLFGTVGDDAEVLIWEPILIPYGDESQEQTPTLTTTETEETESEKENNLQSSSSKSDSKADGCQEPESVRSNSRDSSLSSIRTLSSDVLVGSSPPQDRNC